MQTLHFNFIGNKFLQKNKKTIINFLFSDKNKIDDIEKILRKLPINSAIIFREYNLPLETREAIVVELLKQARKLKIKILIGKNFSLSKKINADGYHYSDRQKFGSEEWLDYIKFRIFSRYNLINKNHSFVYSCSCHSLSSFYKLKNNENFTKIFISPIFTTTSHQEDLPIGMLQLKKIILKNNVFTKNKKICSNKFKEIYPLGGINKKNIKSLSRLNISGFAGIDLFKNL